MLKEIYSKIKTHPDFDDKGYLVHFFGNLRSDFVLEGNWQLGFYNSETDLISTYQLEGDSLSKTEGKALKKEHHHIEALDMDLVTVTFEDMISKVKSFQRENYPGQEPLKIILVLQNHDRTIWNITLVTATFNTLNIKIDATSGEIFHHELANLLQWDASKNS